MRRSYDRLSFCFKKNKLSISLEINLSIVVAALEELLHLLLAGLTGIGTCAGIENCVCSNVVKPVKEYVLRNKSLVCRKSVRTIVVDAVRNVEVIVHLAEIIDKEFDLLIIIGASKSHIINDDAIALLGNRILGVEGNNLWQIHCVCSTVDDV